MCATSSGCFLNSMIESLIKCIIEIISKMNLAVILCYYFLFTEIIETERIGPCKIRHGLYTITVFEGKMPKNPISFSSVNFMTTPSSSSVNTDGHIQISSQYGVSTYELLRYPQSQRTNRTGKHSQFRENIFCCSEEFFNYSSPSVNRLAEVKISLDGYNLTQMRNSYVNLLVAHVTTSRLDVYSDDRYMEAKNIEMVNNVQSLVPINETYFEPDTTSVVNTMQYSVTNNGDNFYDQIEGHLLVNVRLSTTVVIRPVPILMAIVKISVDDKSVDGSEVKETFVKSLIETLNFKPNDVIVMCTRQQTCSNNSESSAFHVKISLENSPAINLKSKSYDNSIKMTTLELSALNSSLIKLVTFVQTNDQRISNGLTYHQITVKSTWFTNEHTTLCPNRRLKRESPADEVTFTTPRLLQFCKSLVNSYVDLPLLVQPQIKFINAAGQMVKGLATASENESWMVKVTLQDGASQAKLNGTTIVPVVDGIARFTDLSLNTIGLSFVLRFAAVIASDTVVLQTTNLTVTSTKFDIRDRPLELRVKQLPYKVKVHQILSPSPQIHIYDSYLQSPASSQFLERYAWTITVYLLNEDYYNGSQLMGTKTKNFTTGSDNVSFNDLYLTEFGYKYRLGVVVVSDPKEYILDAVIGPFYVERDTMIPRQLQDTWLLTIVFNAPYKSVVHQKDSFFVYFLNSYGYRYPEVMWGNISISQGSVITKASISGTTSELQATVQSLQAEVNSGNSATFNGTSMSVVSVTTTSDTDEDSGSRSSGESVQGHTDRNYILPNAWIVAIVLNVLLGIIFLVVIIYWHKRYRRGNRRISDSSSTKIFEKQITTNGHLENKAAAAAGGGRGGGIGKKHDVYTISVEDSRSNRDMRRTSSALSKRSHESNDLKYSDEMSKNNDHVERYNDSRNSLRNSRLHSPSSYHEVRTNSPGLSLDGSDENDEIRPNSAPSWRTESRNSQRYSGPGPNYAYDEREEEEHNREKYLVYEITGDSYRSRDYISYIMLPEENPPTLLKTRDLFYSSNVPTVLQEIANLDYVFIRQGGSQVTPAMETNSLVCDIFPNREILIKVQPPGKASVRNKNDSQNKGFFGGKFVANSLKRFHSRELGVLCQNRDCDKTAVIKCPNCGKAPYCSKRCMLEDQLYHGTVCYKPPWKG